jgi:hypothetical protein
MVSKWWIWPEALRLQIVSKRVNHVFEAGTSAVQAGINRKFTPNQMIRIFREFSAI